VASSIIRTRGLRLAYLTVGWNLIEGVVALIAAGAAGSIALLGFGLDSFVESLSAGVVIWRLIAERHTTDVARIESIERRARRLVGVSLFALAAVVAFEASRSLYMHEHAEPSVVGIVLLVVSFAVMGSLAAAKRRTALSIGSKAMVSDAFQTTACMWLSATALAGISLNAMLGWWWADPVAAIALTWFVVDEGREAWRGEDCCDHDDCHRTP